MTASEIIIKIATVAVVLMIIACIVLLVFVLVNRDDFSQSKDNVIGLKNDAIEIESPEDIETLSFNVSNMFPGDSHTKSYTVKVLDAEVEYISFLTEVVSDNASISDKLIVTLTVGDSANPYFRSTAKDMPDEGVVIPIDGESMTCHVTVTLDTSAGNECQNGEIKLNVLFGGSGVDYTDGRVEE